MAQRNSKRFKWTPETITKLESIYEEQKRNGNKRLWNRIASRFKNENFTIKRQALQYKWKNFCKISLDKSVKLCKNERLIELIFKLISSLGYHGISKLPEFEGVSQSNIKNVFFSNIRSLSRLLKHQIQCSDDFECIVSMLSTRHVHQIANNGDFQFLSFRSRLLHYKNLVQKTKNKPNHFQSDQEISELKSVIQDEYQKLKQLVKNDDGERLCNVNDNLPQLYFHQIQYTNNCRPSVATSSCLHPLEETTKLILLEDCFFIQENSVHQRSPQQAGQESIIGDNLEFNLWSLSDF